MVCDDEAHVVVRSAVHAGMTFIRTADSYGAGPSERIIGDQVGDDPNVFVATKMGRRAEQVPENYTMDNFRTWIADSKANLGTDRIDLIQLHCPPTEVLEDDAVFAALDELVDEGLIGHYGVSVETTDQALLAIGRE